VWQSLYDELKDHAFTVLAVALDHADAARPWIEAAKATYPCLIDREHHLADLYNLVNVPQAVWIDEDGRIVRPPETAGSTDSFRAMDRKTFAVPEAVAAERNRVKTLYIGAVRDWVLRGAASVNALDETQAAAKLKVPDDTIAEAHARFRLGQHLSREGLTVEAQSQIAEAVRLHPDSWAMWRQSAAKDQRGLAAGPEFWARVDALGGKPYYPQADIAEPR
jgi:alkyl hydroperoxide reductase subunit AhpC